MNRRGVALLLALFAILLAAALATAALTTARLRWRTGHGLLMGAEATVAAEASVAFHRVAWDSVAADSLTVGGSMELGVPLTGTGSTRVIDSLLRLGPNLYQLRSIAERLAADNRLLARDDVTALVERITPTLLDSAALVATAPPGITDSATIEGDDHIPAGWEARCPAPAATKPPFVVAPSPFTMLRPSSVADFARRADISAGGTVASPTPVLSPLGACLPAAGNWGDPSGGPCFDWLPLIVLQPGSRIIDGMGQGVLIAMGDLELSGEFSFAGVILSLGGVSLTDQATVFGAILATGPVSLGGEAQVERSVCAVRVALGARQSVVIPVTNGMWRTP